MPKQRTPLNDVLSSDKTERAESAAEETKTNDTPKPAGAAESSEQQEGAMATEQPVPSVPEEKTSQYVVTIDNQSGSIERVEKLTPAGERKELSQEDYEQAGLSSAAEEEDGSEFGSSADDSLQSAYYQGVADYLKSLT